MAEILKGKKAKLAKQQMAPPNPNLFPMWLSSAMRASRLGAIMRAADTGEIQALMSLLQEILTKEISINAMMQVRSAMVESAVIQCVIDETDQSVSESTREEIRQFCQKILDNLLLVRRLNEGGFAAEGDLSALTKRISINSSWFGFFAGWPIWDNWPGSSEIVPVAVESLDNRRFRVRPSDDSLMMLSTNDQVGTPLHTFGEFNTMEVRHNGISAKLSESGIGRPASYAWFIAFSTYVFLLRYTEMTSVPSPLIERAGIDGITPGYTPGNDTEALNFLKNYIAGTQAVMPAGFKLHWSEPGKNGHYLFDFIDKMVSRQYKDLILGQASTTSDKGSTLGGQPAAGMEIQDYVVNGELQKVCAAYRKLLALAVRLNYGPAVRPPKVVVVRDDLPKRLQRLALLKEAKALGFPVSRTMASKELGLSLPADGDILLDGSAYSSKALEGPAAPSTDSPDDEGEDQTISREEKGKGIPVGTRRNWKDGTFEKQEDGSWKKVQ